MDNARATEVGGETSAILKPAVSVVVKMANAMSLQNPYSHQEIQAFRPFLFERQLRLNQIAA